MYFCALSSRLLYCGRHSEGISCGWAGQRTEYPWQVYDNAESISKRPAEVVMWVQGGPRPLSAELGDQGLKNCAWFSELSMPASPSAEQLEGVSSSFWSAKDCKSPYWNQGQRGPLVYAEDEWGCSGSAAWGTAAAVQGWWTTSTPA